LSSFPLINLRNQYSTIFYYSLLTLRIRHKGTYLGFIWAALEPTLLFVLLYTVFSTIRITENENFGIYLLTGLVFYYAFLRGSQGGLMSLRSNAPIMSSINIKKEFFPVANTITSLLQLFVELGVLFSIMLLLQFIPPATIIFLPIVVVLLLMLILGMSYLLSILYVYVQDIHPVWNVFAHALFFITPLFWYLEDTGGILLEIHRINPLGQIIELAHKIIVYGEIPSLYEWSYSFLLVLIILIIGFVVFTKFEKRVVESI